jgi:hypothetical protein
VPGLVAEAGTVEELLDDIRVLVPELLDLNGVPHPKLIDVQLTAARAIELAA